MPDNNDVFISLPNGREVWVGYFDDKYDEVDLSNERVMEVVQQLEDNPDMLGEYNPSGRNEYQWWLDPSLSRDGEGLLVIETFIWEDGDHVWINPSSPSWKSSNVIEDAKLEFEEEVKQADYPRVRIIKNRNGEPVWMVSVGPPNWITININSEDETRRTMSCYGISDDIIEQRLNSVRETAVAAAEAAKQPWSGVVYLVEIRPELPRFSWGVFITTRYRNDDEAIMVGFYASSEEAEKSMREQMPEYEEFAVVDAGSVNEACIHDKFGYPSIIRTTNLRRVG